MQNLLMLDVNWVWLHQAQVQRLPSGGRRVNLLRLHRHRRDIPQLDMQIPQLFIRHR